MKNINTYYLPASIVISGIFISASIYYGFGLDVLQKLFSIIGSLSLGVALAAYFYKRSQDKTIAAIEQISFFRKEIIQKWDEVAEVIKSKNKKYIFSSIRIDEPTIEFIRKHYSKNFKSQTSIFFDVSKIDSTLWDARILDSQVHLFNMLEEFSLKVLHFGTEHHQALNSVHAAFVEIVEKNAAALIFVRDIVTANPIYSATLSLYNSWRQDANKSYVIENLEKYGFITKQQKEKFLNDIKNSKN